MRNMNRIVRVMTPCLWRETKQPLNTRDTTVTRKVRITFGVSRDVYLATLCKEPFNDSLYTDIVMKNDRGWFDRGERWDAVNRRENASAEGVKAQGAQKIEIQEAATVSNARINSHPMKILAEALKRKGSFFDASREVLFRRFAIGIATLTTLRFCINPGYTALRCIKFL